MKIPRSFQIAGHTIRVVRVRTKKRWGLYHPDKKRIEVCYAQKGVPRSHIEQTFCHELMHCLFDHAKRDDLYYDEALVDLLGDLLHQALTTAK